MRPVELTRILRQHLQLPPKHAPRLPIHRVRMAHGVHVRPRAVHRPMNQIPRLVRGPAARPGIQHRARVHVQQDQVRRPHQPEVASQRVRPEGMRVLRVAHADVAGHALDEALAGPVPECGGQVVL